MTLPAVSTFKLADYGVRADGVTDDKDAFVRAVDAAQHAGGGNLIVPNGRMVILGGWVELPSNITLVGAGTSSEVIFKTNSPDWRLLFRVVGDNVTMKNLKLTRVSDTPGVMIDLRASSNFTLDGVVIDGRRDSLKSECHGILIYGAAPQVIRNMTIIRSTVRRVDYGLLQPSERTVTVDGVTVDRSTFELNYATDLEFNAPLAQNRRIAVKNSRFRSNKSTSESAGWAVGLANVQGSVISNNDIRDYAMNAVHVEDRSREVVIVNNTFTNTSTRDTGYASSVFVISGSRDVNITGNTFNNTTLPVGGAAVYVGSGGSTMQPSNIVLTNNTFALSPSASALVQYGAQNVASYANLTR